MYLAIKVKAKLHSVKSIPSTHSKSKVKKKKASPKLSKTRY